MKQFFIFTAVVFSAFTLCGATMLAPDLGAGKLDYVQQNGKKVYADLRSKYGDTYKEELDAIEGWYFAVSEGVNYVLNPSGSLSSVVSGWGEKANAIEMAERAYNLKK